MDKSKTIKIKDVLARLNSLAPVALAYQWDNCGLLVGDKESVVQRVFITLDVTPHAVEMALESGAQLILSHHPVIFQPLKNITNPLLLRLIKNDIAVISMHTNLDVVPQGVNYALAEALGLHVMEPLSLQTGQSWHHLSVTVPPEYAQAVQEAVFAAGGGVIGSYDSCSTVHPIIGSFRSGEDARPFIKGEGLQKVEELELEFMIDTAVLNAVLMAIGRAHPYQTPALYHFPVANHNPRYGLGLLCDAPEPLNMDNLIQRVRQNLHNPAPRLWTAGKDTATPLKRIAICGGSGGSLLAAAQAQADIYISGDFSYHQMLDATIPLIDAGHYYTEYPVLRYLDAYISGLGLESVVIPLEAHEFSQFHRQ
ncbi:MAG: Nif3-like dinuclear metal center hexameric protein [Candidatus Cloacimonetes bacterium]|nr:Nif3-like dinuclear metal center hexameric protein [Candidatus Cloacimonadota bacterium]